jgi:hypothetical protein
LRHTSSADERANTFDTISLLILVAINTQAAVPETSPSINVSKVLGSVAFAVVVGSGALAKLCTMVCKLTPKRAVSTSGGGSSSTVSDSQVVLGN